VTGFNGTGHNLVLVWQINNAPNANLFNCFRTLDFLVPQPLMQISTCVVLSGQPFTCCVPVPNVCFQADVAVKFQGDLGFYTWDQVAHNCGLIGIPLDIVSGTNVVSGFLMGGDCQQPECCIHMTGGGGTVMTLGGVSVSTKEGFQLWSTNSGNHSNLELHWTDLQGVTHVFKVGPHDSTDLHCASTITPDCPGGGHPSDKVNTIWGTANGSLDGQPGTIQLNYVDCGEPGGNDTRTINILNWQNVPILTVASGTIQNGNNQAHLCK